jgi:hypothetical protein
MTWRHGAMGRVAGGDGADGGGLGAGAAFGGAGPGGTGGGPGGRHEPLGCETATTSHSRPKEKGSEALLDAPSPLQVPGIAPWNPAAGGTFQVPRTSPTPQEPETLATPQADVA